MGFNSGFKGLILQNFLGVLCSKIVMIRNVKFVNIWLLVGKPERKEAIGETKT